MEEAYGLVGVPVLDAEAGADDPCCVGKDGDGDGGEGQHDATPGAALQKVPVEDGDGEEAHEGADTAAGLGDLQLHGRQLDDVAVAQDRHAEERQNGAGQREANSCRGKVIWLKIDRGNGDGQQKDEDGEANFAQHDAADQVQTTPPRSMTSERRERKSSAP